MASSRKLWGAVLAMTTAMTFVTVACSSRPVCASEVVLERGGGASGGGGGGAGGGGGRSSGGASSGGRTSGGASSGGKPSPGAPARSSNGNPSGRSSAATQSRTATQQKAAGSMVGKPGTKPDAATSASVRSSAPPRVTRNGSYTSSVTGNTYVFHSISFYQRPGYFVDYGDPYNYYNYVYFRDSPFFGLPYRYAVDCGGPEKTAPQPDVNNINITVDQDGKITSATDKNPIPDELKEPVEADEEKPLDPAGTAPPTTEGE